MKMKTTDEKAGEFSASLSNQSGTYAKGEIETAFVCGYNKALEEIGSNALACIMERKRQIEMEGFDLKRDDSYTDEELPCLAASYLMAPLYRKTKVIPPYFPRRWDWSWWKPAKDNSVKERLRELSKSGALILAEMDRLVRSENNVEAEDYSRYGHTLFISQDEYYAIKNSISSIHQVIGAFNHEGMAKTRRLEFAKKLENLVERYETERR
nr:MAG TPA: hypothetical protein [Caudoviricetes sp.]